MAHARMVALLIVTAFVAPRSAMAQRWGSEPTPRDGACFYEHAEHHGDYFCVKAGEELSAISGSMNDRISSIRIFGRAEVSVFKDERFHGSSARFANDVRDLRDENWNDRISSLRVRHSSHGQSGGYGSDAHRQEDPERIVRRAYQDVLAREPDADGMRTYRSRIIDDGWSEAQVRDALRKSPEYIEKNTMTRQKAEDIVRRAYLSVLKREPDSGSRSYVDKVLRDKWKQADVENELRKSPEYRNRGR